MYVLVTETLDYVSMAVQIATLVVTGVGLWFVVGSLRQTDEQQRIEAGPYVRVDLGSLDAEMPDFEQPAVHYRSREQVTDLSDGEGAPILISAWFRNYQSHVLGIAFGVKARFLVEVDNLDSRVNEVAIPYLESGKPVLIDIVRCSMGQSARVILIELSFYDFYDRIHAHNYGSKGTNGLHGRLRAMWEGGTITSDPEGRSMGSGVDFREQGD